MMSSLKFIKRYLCRLYGVPKARATHAGQALKDSLKMLTYKNRLRVLACFLPCLSFLGHALKRLSIVGAIIFLTACASSGKKNISANVESEQIEIPAEAAQKFSVAIQTMGSGKTEQAEKQFLELAQTYPQLSGPHANLGVIYAKKKDWDKAESALTTAVERNKKNAKAYNQLGFVYRQQGRFKEAESAYLKSIAIDPSFADAYLNMGILCDLYLGKMKRAAKYYSQYQSMQGAPNRQVAGWLVDINRRIGVQAKTKGQVAGGSQ